MSILAIPSALETLRGQLATTVSAQDIALPLRALQLRGLSKLELVVHVERLRAANDATNADEHFEDQCLVALDIIHGAVPALGLTWDPRQEAASLLPRCLERDDVRNAVPLAVEPSDLLPPRPGPTAASSHLSALLGDVVFNGMTSYALFPERADLVRAPRGTFTTRPAALMRLFDRVVLEALTSAVSSRLTVALPDQVLWPRARDLAPPTSASQAVLGWESRYVVKADITTFYASIEHAQLAVFLNSHLMLPMPHARAIEAMLDSTMGGARGLPQGPPCSDILASAYLLPIDQLLAERATRYVRYADDYYLPVDTMGEGRRVLQDLEALLQDVGLSLNQSKTYIMRRETYEAGLEGSGPAVQRIKQEIAARRLDALESADGSVDAEEILERLGVPEETSWALLYHQTIDVEDVVQQLVEAIGPEYATLYAAFFRQVARQLRESGGDAELAPWAALAQESLVLLTSSAVDVATNDLRIVHLWFPELTPYVVRYLTSGERATAKWVRDYFAAHLRDITGIDWLDAWMCHGTALLPGLGRGAAASLRRLLKGAAAGPLTKAEAVRCLAAHGRLGEHEWRHSFAEASPAVSAEMLFAALAHRDAYPWLANDLRNLVDEPFQALAALDSGLWAEDSAKNVDLDDPVQT